LLLLWLGVAQSTPTTISSLSPGGNNAQPQQDEYTEIHLYDDTSSSVPAYRTPQDEQEEDEEPLLLTPSLSRSRNRKTQETREDVVNFVFTAATLLSGDLTECHNATDLTCEGGVAAVAAYLRTLAGTDSSGQSTPTLVLPTLQRTSQFVMVHPLGWYVNRLILQGILGWKLFLSPPSLLVQNSTHRDLSYLQNFPLVISNVNIPPDNSWHSEHGRGQHRYVYWDDATNLALLTIVDNGQVLNYPQAESAIGLLEAVAQENANLGKHCVYSSNDDDEKEALYASYQVYYNGQGVVEEEDSTANATTTDTNDRPKCWIPIIFYYDGEAGNFDLFVHAMRQAPHPPAIIFNAERINNNGTYAEPTRVSLLSSESNTTNQPSQPQQAIRESSIWIHWYPQDPSQYGQHQITIQRDSEKNEPPSITNLTYMQYSLADLPESYKDDVYAQHITLLQELATEAMGHDTVVGESLAMPPQREGAYYRCNGGECESGNLFADALQFKSDSDIAFLSSGGLRGMGWPEGPVLLSNLWATLPFPNLICTGNLCWSR